MLGRPTPAVRLLELEASDDRIEQLALRVGRAGHRAVRAGRRITRRPGTLRRLSFAERGGRRAGRRSRCPTPGCLRSCRRPSPARTGPTRSSCCSAPTRAASRTAWPRPPPAASCPGSGSRSRSCSPPARPAGTLVFDEVDAGVGGRVAVEIGRRLAQLARHSQVIVVTHLAQVAAFADRHYVVVKSDDGQVTTSGVQLVADERAGRRAGPDDGRAGDHRVGPGPRRRAGRAGRRAPAGAIGPRPDRNRSASIGCEPSDKRDARARATRSIGGRGRMSAR